MGERRVIAYLAEEAAKLKQLFMEKRTAEQPADDLDTWCMKAREAVLQAASTLQYDSAVYAGSQLGVQLGPSHLVTDSKSKANWTDRWRKRTTTNPSERKWRLPWKSSMAI